MTNDEVSNDEQEPKKAGSAFVIRYSLFVIPFVIGYFVIRHLTIGDLTSHFTY